MLLKENENIINLIKDRGFKMFLKKNEDYFTLDLDNNLYKNGNFIKSLNSNSILYYNYQQDTKNIYFLFSNNLIEYDCISNNSYSVNSLKLTDHKNVSFDIWKKK